MVNGVMKLAQKNKDSAMLPLSDEYEETITSLKAEISKFWDELDRLQTQVKTVTAENEVLTGQLVEAARLPTAAAAAAAVPVPSHGDQQLQLQAAIKERDSAVQLWQAGLKEVERLETALAAARTDGSSERWQRYTDQIRSQYARAVGTVTAELARQRAEAERTADALSAAEEAARAVEAAAATQRQQLQRLTERLGEADRRALQQAEQQQQLQAELQLLQESAAGHDERLRRAAEEAERLTQDLLEARQRCVQLSQREAEALDKLKEGVDVVQNALIEKEEAVQKAARLEGDVADLEASLGRLAEEAGLRTAQEVAAIREQGNKRLAELADTLQQKDAAEVEQQQQLERLLREKKKVESEYDRLKEEHGRCQSGGLQCDALQELTDRLSRLEDARIEAEGTAAELTRKLTSAQARHQIELERAAEDHAEQQRRLAEISDTCDELLAQKRALTEQLEAARAQHDAELTAATERRRELERTASSLEQKLRQKERLLSVEIQSYETDHEHTKTELRQQLAEQQQVSARWRRELSSATDQSERKLAQMRSVERDLARNITELEDQLREATSRQLESEEEVKRYKYRVRELELRVQTAEKRFLTIRSGSRRGLAAAAGAGDPRRQQLED